MRSDQALLKRDLGSLPNCRLPKKAGVGFKPQHFEDALGHKGEVAWLEIHAENYMGDGGRPISQLRILAERYPISVHGVGLSIGGEGPLDRDHLARVKRLVSWLNPASFSEHLAWSTHEERFLNDLLPLPYTSESLARVAEHIHEVQETLGRRILLENPSTYLAFAESEMSEVSFLTELVRRTGCGLLLDVNNVFVSAANLEFDAFIYVSALDHTAVDEIHLGGHDAETEAGGQQLLIDSHGRAVADPVWDLFAHTIAVGGPKPTLIEWDNNVPDWRVLANEAARASSFLV